MKREIRLSYAFHLRYHGSAAANRYARSIDIGFERNLQVRHTTMNQLGFIRITAGSIRTHVACPTANRTEIERFLDAHSDADIVVLPELCLSGYTCGELFAQDTLLESCLHELNSLACWTSGRSQLVVVGLPMRIDGQLYNIAAALHGGRILGLVAKQYLPNYQEFYESRWFAAGSRDMPKHFATSDFGLVPCGIDLLFEAGPVVVGIEICEDLWIPVPPSSLQALAGANVLLNLSASNETIGKSSYRTQLVTSQSGRCCAAYAYSSAGPTESTTDLVFGGHCLIAENGAVLAESSRIGTGLLERDATDAATTDVDIQRLIHDRQVIGTLYQGRTSVTTASFRRIAFSLEDVERPLIRSVSGRPFVPSDTHELHLRCREIFEIQCAGLAKRVSRLPERIPLLIGVSGGLDSTLALLVATWTCRSQGWPLRRIHGLTMPGFGTSKQSRSNALGLMERLGIRSDCVDIRPACMQIFRDMGHAPFGIPLDGLSIEEFQSQLESLPPEHRSDLVFENVQARVRTLQLMSRGFVLGTGDLSESALGWSTYNGDHMSMYNVNASVPKTLVQFLIRHVAEHYFDGAVSRILTEIVDSPITPELLPLSTDQTVVQSTEGSIGPYELHDFFLYHVVRCGAGPRKILFLAKHADFSKPYSHQEIASTLKTFLRRFFDNQFKRSCVPDGPKVGSVSLSPRSDWRMPSDAEVRAWLEQVD